MRYQAMLALDGNVQRPCILSDISDTGARIDVESADELPDSFVLLLSGNGSPRRNCHIVWRKPNNVGVNFEGRLPLEERTGLVPDMSADQTPEVTDAMPVKAID